LAQVDRLSARDRSGVEEPGSGGALRRLPALVGGRADLRGPGLRDNQITIAAARPSPPSPSPRACGEPRCVGDSTLSQKALSLLRPTGLDDGANAPALLAADLMRAEQPGEPRRRSATHDAGA